MNGTYVTMLPKQLQKKKTTDQDWTEDKESALENSIKPHDYNKKNLQQTSEIHKL